MEEAERRALVRKVVAEHGTPRARRGAVLAVTSIGPYVLALVGGTWAAAAGRWPIVALAVLAASAFAVRMFCAMHECSHGSVVGSPRLDAALGHTLGALTVTPFGAWRRRHLLHHAALGDLDRRAWHDYPTLTVDEYVSRSTTRRALYRLARHPLVILCVVPVLFLGIVQRFPAPQSSRREKVQVAALDLVLLAVTVTLWRFGVLGAFAAVQLPVFVIAGAAGYYLFHVQHQFPDGWWARTDAWSWGDAAWRGSSFLALPRPLQWITCTIGYHHVHHLAPRIPGDRLARCHELLAPLGAPTRIGLRDSRACFRRALWDESSGRLVSFRDAAATTDERARSDL
jgi:omega-6 fatty acid desaturase (delta-12 desaturase)